MTAYLPFFFDAQFFTNAGAPAASHLLYTYQSGTTTDKATYTNSLGTVANANPIVLNSAGRCAIWMTPGAYTLVLKTAAGVLVKQWDGVQSQADVSAYTAPYTGAVERSIESRLAERVSIKDFGASSSATAADNNDAIQAAIDSLTDGGSVFVPGEEFAVLGGIKLDGSDGTLSNISIYGEGAASALIQSGSARESGVPDGDTTQSPNVLEALSGSGFIVRNLRIVGNKDSGGVTPNPADTWAVSTAYTYSALSPVYVQAKSDGTAIVTESSTDKVWKLLVSHTSNATDIDTDVALGRWEAVTNYAALNGWYYDESKNRANCIAVYGPVGGSAVENVLIENCVISGGIHAAILRGSGPSKGGMKSAGVSNVRITGNTITSSASGVTGLVATEVSVTTNTIESTGELINIDEDCDLHVISGNVLSGDATDGARSGIASFSSSNVTATGNTITNCQVGINFQDSGLTTDRGGSITGNTIIDCGQVGASGAGTGIFVSSCDHVAVSGNQIFSPFNNGIKVTGSNDVTATGNNVTDAGAWGIDFEDCVGVSCTGNTMKTIGFDCIFFEGVRGGAITGNICVDGNDADSATLYSGIRIGPYFTTDSTNITVTGNVCRDVRATKLQHYGLTIEAGTTAVLAIGNNFLGNDDGEVSNGGTACPIGFNTAASTASLRVESTISPTADEGQALGASAFRWSNIYGTKIRAGDGTVFWTTGTGTPEGAVTGDIGCLYTRLDGGASTTLYVKTSGTGNTGWTAK